MRAALAGSTGFAVLTAPPALRIKPHAVNGDTVWFIKGGYWGEHLAAWPSFFQFNEILDILLLDIREQLKIS